MLAQSSSLRVTYNVKYEYISFFCVILLSKVKSAVGEVSVVGFILLEY